MPINQDIAAFRKTKTPKRDARPAPHTRASRPVDIVCDTGAVSLLIGFTPRGQRHLNNHLGPIAQLWGTYLADRQDCALVIRQALAGDLVCRVNGKVLRAEP